MLSKANKAAYSVLCTCPRTINYLPATPTVNIYLSTTPPPKYGMTHKLENPNSDWLVVEQQAHDMHASHGAGLCVTICLNGGDLILSLLSGFLIFFSIARVHKYIIR